MLAVATDIFAVLLATHLKCSGRLLAHSVRKSKEVKAEGQRISSPDMSICPLSNLSLKVIQSSTTVWEKGTKMRASSIIIKCSIIMHVYYLLHVWYRNYMIHKLKTQNI